MSNGIKPMNINMGMLNFWERRNIFKDVSSIEKISKMIKVIDPDGSKMAAIHKKYYCENLV